MIVTAFDHCDGWLYAASVKPDGVDIVLVPNSLARFSFPRKLRGLEDLHRWEAHMYAMADSYLDRFDAGIMVLAPKHEYTDQPLTGGLAEWSRAIDTAKQTLRAWQQHEKEVLHKK
jgi:hypothetical protein